MFASGVEAVYLDVFVTRGGEPVAGLRAAELELRDNGVVQRPELLAAESRPLRAVLVFDTSSSMVGERLAALRAAGEAFLDGLRPADEAALLGFSEEIAWLVPPTPDKAAVRSALGRMEATGATAVFDALYAAIALSEVGQRPLIVLFSDGEDNLSWLGARELRDTAERSNALVHVVTWRAPAPVPGRGSAAAAFAPEHEDALRRIAEATGGRFWWADSPARLRAAFTEIADTMRHRYVLRYEPEGVARLGWHRIELRLKGRKGEAHSRPGYWVRPDTD